jgi:hypothetical protein
MFASILACLRLGQCNSQRDGLSRVLADTLIGNSRLIGDSKASDRWMRIGWERRRGADIPYPDDDESG